MAEAEKLIEKIKSDAQHDAEQYWHDAEENKQQMRDALLQEIDILKKEMENAAHETAEENKKRLAAIYDLEYRKKLLSAKQEIMQQVKSLALQKLCALSDAEYISLMKNRLLRCTKTGEGGIAVSKNETRLTETFLSEVNQYLEKTLGNGNIRFLPEKRDILGGFIFIDGGMEINISLEALLNEAWQNAETDVAKLLFE
ncbi:MAG: V-type ATP synthase subunit E [Christensenellales bacterium]